MDMHNTHSQEHAGGMHPQHPPEEEPSSSDPTFGGHGQLIVGTGPIYLSHLPMFMFNPKKHPHNFQVLLEVTFTASDGGDPQATYVRDRVDTGTKVYTLSPDPFVMLDLVRPDRQHARVRSFRGDIFRNHFERPGPVGVDTPEHPLLGNAVVDVEHVVYFQEFDPQAEPLHLLEYLLFGKGEQLFLAHRITRPPDFDHVLAVEVTNHQFTDDELRNAIPVRFHRRMNTLDHCLREGETVFASARVERADGPDHVEVTLKIGEEFYLESRELSHAM